MDREETLALLDEGIEERGFHSVGGTRATRSSGSSGAITLSDVDGVLRWDIGGKRRVTRGESKRLKSYRFEDLSPNQISKKLRDLDAWLTPNQGLYQIEQGRIRDESLPVSEGRILLFIHGTFSNTENLVGAFHNTAEGQAFLTWASDHYDQILAFGHPTLSVSPFLNAVNLSRIFATSNAEVDVICHSRGGLVARWWLEAITPPDAPTRRVVFVGAPLGGTGLATPANIRQSLDLLANFSAKLATAAGIGSVILPIAAPIFQASAVVASIVSMVSSAGASTPAVDAAVCLIPDLAAQSRQSANNEILGLRKGFAAESIRERLDTQTQRYFFVVANFETDDPGWAFWRVFRNIPGRAADALTDVVFDGTNDLVVDTASMTDLADDFGELDRERQIKDFGTTDQVHHCNYFQFPETIAFIQKSIA
ncbi:MAG TPA: hypothetical protein QF564_25930 [Pirellulaceae bacterium]|jgi:hypothetical protein|nr:hypothetical protein [Pirellulaceae bacterium]